MLLPIKHEKMAARRWPVITLALIAVNTLAFLATHDTIAEQGHRIGEAKAHLLMLTAMHPELTLRPEAQQFVDNFRTTHQNLWAQIQHPNRDVADAWDARIRMMEDTERLQAEMDSIANDYVELSSSALTERYAFIPAAPKPAAYLTANFLHGGWLHLIGNMWFLWLAGFVLEDVWGRVSYTIFYFLAGAAALQFYAWTNPGSITPTLGASGAVAALMGAFLVRFPTMKIEMAWLFAFRIYRFKAAAMWLLPLWLLMEVFYGTIFGQVSGVAHWAHVGGFLFGAAAAVLLKLSGIEHKLEESIEADLTLNNDPELVQAADQLHANQFDQASAVLKEYLQKKPDSVDAWNLLQQVCWRKGDLPAYFEAATKACGMYLKARESQAAWEIYEEFLKAGGQTMPIGIWFDLCRSAEERQDYERAVEEYRKLIAAYPKERQSLQAQLGAARVCLKRLNRPQDALTLYEAAACSPIPHLDWDQAISAGIREAKAAMGQPATAAAKA